MSELPPLLRPWREELEGLRPEDVAVLGPWVPRLAQAVGPMAGSTAVGDGEPDGVGGLARRGPWERLLTSEWGLAQAAPLEFLRRAAQSEQLFLELRRLQPTGSRRCVALLDSGPDQLGLPRLVQLAVLVVLARRAVRAGAEFLWGSLQDDERVLRSVDADTLRNLGSARRPHRATERQLKRWTERLGSDEVWLVGRVGELEGRRIEIAQPLLGPLQVRVGQTEVELPRPDGRRAARLFREAKPPAAGRRANLSVDPDLGASFSRCGRRLIVGLRERDDEGRRRLAGLHVPDNTRSAPGKPLVLRVPDGVRVLAADWVRRKAWVLADDDDGDRGLWTARRGELEWEAHNFSCPADGSAREFLHPAWLHDEDAPSLLCADGKLMRLSPLYGPPAPGDEPPWDPAEEASRGPAVLETHCLALDRQDHRLVYAAANDASWVHVVASVGGKLIGSERFAGPGPFEARFGHPGADSAPSFGLVALRVQPEAWVLLYGSAWPDKEPRRLELPRSRLPLPDPPRNPWLPGESSWLLGPASAAAGGAHLPGLVHVAPDRRRLCWVTEGHRRDYHSLPEPIVAAKLSTARCQAVLLLESGELRVRCLLEDRDLLVVAPEEAAP